MLIIAVTHLDLNTELHTKYGATFQFNRTPIFDSSISQLRGQR